MRPGNTKDTGPTAKTKVKIKTLKLGKETVARLTDQDAAAVKGGGYTSKCGGGVQT